MYCSVYFLFSKKSHSKNEFERTLEDYASLSQKYPRPDDNTREADDEPKNGSDRVEAAESVIFTAPGVSDSKEEEELVRSESNILRVSHAFEQLLLLTLDTAEETSDGEKTRAAKSEGVPRDRKQEASDSLDIPSEAETESRSHVTWFC